MNEHGALVQTYGKGISICSTEYLSKYYFCYHKCHMDYLGTEPGPSAVRGSELPLVLLKVHVSIWFSFKHRNN